MKKDSFIFYNSWLEGLKGFSELEQGEIALVLLRYAAYGTEPDEDKSPAAKMAFSYAKPLIDNNNIRYKVGCLGGAPVGNRNAKKQPSVVLSDTQEALSKQPNDNVYVYDNANPNENENEIRRSGSSSSHSTECDEAYDAEAVSNSRKIKTEKFGTVKEVVEYYNTRITEMNAQLHSCATVSDKRRGAISARLDEYGKDKVLEMIDKAVESRFLNYDGDIAPVGIDWLFKPNNFLKVLEGNYNKSKKYKKNVYEHSYSKVEPSRNNRGGDSDDGRKREYTDTI